MEYKEPELRSGILNGKLTAGGKTADDVFVVELVTAREYIREYVRKHGIRPTAAVVGSEGSPIPSCP